MRISLFIKSCIVSSMILGAICHGANAGAQTETSEGHLAESIDATITFLYYDDLDAAAEFYDDVLQLKATMDAQWVKIFEITQGSSVGLVKKGFGQHQPSAEKPVMLSIVTTDVEAWYAYLLQENVPILKALPPATEEQKPGSAPVRGFIATDPGGYTVEFFTWLSTP